MPPSLTKQAKTYRLNLRLEPALGQELEALCQARGAGAYGPTTFAAQLLRERLDQLRTARPKVR